MSSEAWSPPAFARDLSINAPLVPLQAGLLTPDRRYVVIRQRLFRAGDPSLPVSARRAYVNRLEMAQQEARQAHEGRDPVALRRAQLAADDARAQLGERGPVWWDDGAPDLSWCRVASSPYASWHAAQTGPLTVPGTFVGAAGMSATPAIA